MSSTSKSGGYPVQHISDETKTAPSGCPVKHNSSQRGDGCPADRGGMMDALGVQSAENQSAAAVQHNTRANDMAFGQDRYPGQKLPLSTHRSTSTIPNDDFIPSHQPAGTKEWVYPSEQQYYNAMKRKGYNPNESDVPVILAIHNTVNERGWSQLKQWEQLRGCTTPKLKKFMGRPKDISPKAYLKSFMGYSLPFDRHDWIVDSNGTETRYVIDFYKGSTSKAMQEQAAKGGNIPAASKLPLPVIAMHLDVRPAVDSPSAALLRLRVFVWRMLGFNPLGKGSSSETEHK